MAKMKPCDNPIADNATSLRDKSFWTTKNYQDLYLGGFQLTEDYDIPMSDLMAYLPATEKEMQSIEVNVITSVYLKWTPRRFITMQLNIRFKRDLSDRRNFQ